MSEEHRRDVDRVAVERWVAAYEDLWRTEGTGRLGGLFTADVTYRASPWRDPVRGVDAIADFWEVGRDGHDEVFTMSSEVVATDGDVGVVRVEVDYEHGTPWRDLWILRFAPGGQVVAFEEWPFAPGTPDGH